MTTKFNPRVSIVIPVYNGSDYLAEAIDSALAQTYDNIEIIVVNDGSRDEGKTALVANAYGDKIRYFQKENGGVASALNFGISKMDGEYFSWLSHDDLYYKDKIKSQISYLLNLPAPERLCTIMYCNTELVNSKGNHIGFSKVPKFKNEEFLFTIARYRFFGGCTLLIPKTAFSVIGLFDNTLKTVQDYKLWYQFILGGFIFKMHQEVLVKTRIHPGQDSNTKRALFTIEEDALFTYLLENATREQLWGSLKNGSMHYLYLALYYSWCEYRNAARLALDLARKCTKTVGFRIVLVAIFQSTRSFRILKLVRNAIRVKNYE